MGDDEFSGIPAAHTDPHEPGAELRRDERLAQSAMPGGLLPGLTPQEVADLLVRLCNADQH